MNETGQRGRPPVTRTRVLRYWERNGPCPVKRVAKVLGVDRRYVQKVLMQSKDMLISGMDIKISDAVRFWAKVDKSPGLGPEGDCWHWTKTLDASGYPHGFNIEGRSYRASHISMALHGNPRLDETLIALHSCDNKICVNPGHLRWGTDAENAEDHRQRGARGARWLPDETVWEILTSTERNKDIAARLGITAPAVCNIRKGRYHRKIFEEYCHTAAG